MRELREWVNTALTVGAVVAAIVLYRKLFSGQDALIPSAAKLKESVGSIVTGTPSALKSFIRGEDESTYITWGEQQKLADAALAAARQAKAYPKG